MSGNSSAPPSLDGLSADLHEAWESFIDAVEPLRPQLFRFCHRLTGSAFDAEDLVHDGLLRAFGTLGLNRQGIRDMRSFLFRVLTNLWIDETRRSRPELREPDERTPDPGAPSPASAPELRDAAQTLLGALSPRERVAVVLREGFDLSHAQIAEVLSSSAGAVKVALHRGRQRLEKERASDAPRPRVSRALVDRFVEAFRSRDIEAVKALLLENVEAEVYPSGLIVGRDVNAERGWLRGCFYHHIPEREASRAPYPLGLQVREVEGEPVVLVFRDYGDGQGAALEEVWRFEEEDGAIARVRDYGFSPDLVEHVARHLGLPFRRVGYRFRPGFFRDTNVSEVAL